MLCINPVLKSVRTRKQSGSKAYLLLDREFQLPPIDIYLYKHIPSGAGLGGGSADAAFMLKLLNEKFHLHLTDEKLEEYAAMLGADCAFL